MCAQLQKRGAPDGPAILGSLRTGCTPNKRPKHALYASVDQFSDDLIAHVHLENNLLFQQFEAARSGCC